MDNRTNNYLLDKGLLLTGSNVYKYLFQNFIPLAITSTLLAPIERIKIILQTMKLMSIRDSEKVYGINQLSRSNSYINK
jgi:hypothetical protein